MIQRAFANYSYIEASMLALFLFLGVFVGLMFWVYRRDSSKIYQSISHLPLSEETEGN